MIFSCKYWKITNNTGITTNPKNVPINKPTAAPVAIERFPTAQIHVAKMRGNKPKINANEVIKIGLNLAFAVLMADITKVSP